MEKNRETWQIRNIRLKESRENGLDRNKCQKGGNPPSTWLTSIRSRPTTRSFAWQSWSSWRSPKSDAGAGYIKINRSDSKCLRIGGPNPGPNRRRLALLTRRRPRSQDDHWTPWPGRFRGSWTAPTSRTSPRRWWEVSRRLWRKRLKTFKTWKYLNKELIFTLRSCLAFSLLILIF